MRKSKGSGHHAPERPRDPRGLTNGLQDPRSETKRSARADSGRGSYGLTNGITNGLTNGLSNGIRTIGLGLTNGMVVGRSVGRTNGMTNGRVNGKTNGLTNGRRYGFTNGLTNGLTNGITNGLRTIAHGLTNGKGKGRVNGLTNGFVNGAGAVNGFRVSYQPRRMGSGPANVKTKLWVVGVLVLLAVSVPYALVYTFPPEEIEIDGYFLDWLEAQMYEDTPDSTNPDTTLIAYAMKSDSRGSYFYLETQGAVFNGRDGGADGFYIFVDVDGDPETGYYVRGLGADALVATVGWNSTLERAETFMFDSEASGYDYSGFEHWSSPAVAFKGGQMEVGVQLLTSQRSAVAVSARHTNLSDDWSEVNFLSRGSAVRVVQDHDAPSVTQGLKDEQMLTVTISCKGPGVWVEGLNLTFLGNATPELLTAMRGQETVGTSTDEFLELEEPIRVSTDRDLELRILATFADDAVQSSFGLELFEEDPLELSSNATITVKTVQTGEKVAYIAEAPAKVAVDGGFGDWTYKPMVVDSLCDGETRDSTVLPSSNADITAAKVSASEDAASFFLSVNGSMLGGSSVPSNVVRWAEPSGTAGNITNITTSVTGTDFAFVFIDLDWNYSTGFYIGGSEASIVVVGKAGKVLASRTFMFADDVWTPTGDALAALDDHRLEVSGSFESLGMTYGMAYAVTFLAQDWFGCEDCAEIAFSARASVSTRGVPGVIINEIYSTSTVGGDWIELYNTATYEIDLSGWTIVVDGVVVYTFLPDSVIAPGEIIVIDTVEFGKGKLFELIDGTTVEDSILLPTTWKVRSYGRTGISPYDNWTWMTPTPGELNVGQVAIPEFGDLLIPLTIIPITLIAIRRSKLALRGRKGW